MGNEVEFPLVVKFEDGEEDIYESITDLEQNLEHFDSDRSVECEVRDHLGRRVRLKLYLLQLKTLELMDEEIS